MATTVTTPCVVPYTEFEWSYIGKPRPDSAGLIDEPCPECGHMAFVHPGPGNPAIDACLLCRLTEAAGA